MTPIIIDEITFEKFEEIYGRAESNVLTKEDALKIRQIGDTLILVTEKLNEKRITISNLRKYLYGSMSEKRNQSDITDNQPNTESSNNEEGESENSSDDKKKRKKRKGGNGKTGADEYVGAETITISHETLCSGSCCPDCHRGKLSHVDPVKEIRILGVAPLGALKYEMDQLRCNLCQSYFKADLPEEAGNEKFHDSAVAILGLLKYGLGLPFYRIARLQEAFGIPISESTQFEVLLKSYESVISKLFEALQWACAQSHTIHIDDTTMRILEMMGKRREQYLVENPDITRKGIYTTGHVCISENYIGVFFKSGKNHAGENFDQLMMLRDSSLPKPMLMCDALGCNTSGTYKPEVLNCLTHARRKFVELQHQFPKAIKFILDIYTNIYINDDWAKQCAYSDEERMEYHASKSKPLMDKLHAYLLEIQPKVEKNTYFQKAIKYSLKNWEKLTKFYRIPGAPLDNNVCEQILKKPILNRKNAMFYKTQNGADVGDAYMSLIHSCEVNKIHPFKYLEAVLSNADRVAQNPRDWLPWNYHLNDGISTG